MFALVQRASVTATPAPTRIEAVLRRHEAADRVIRAITKPLSRTHVDALKAREKVARADIAAVSAEIDAVGAKISGLQIDRSRRARLPWSRWLPDRDTNNVITGLMNNREVLRSRVATLAKTRLRAEVYGERAARDLVVAQARADRERRVTIRTADKRLAILARARKLILSVPALAYIGAKRLLAVATRIERARETGWDPGPGSSTP